MVQGRPPKPTRLKILTGNPGKRPLNKREPKPAAGAPSCPSWLDAEAKAEWKRIVKDLDRLGMLAKVDRATLSAYCQAWAEFHRATRVIRKEGAYYTTEAGYVQKHPAVSDQRTAWQAIRQFSALFGLDPSSRGKLQVPAADKEKDSLEAFLGDAG